VLKIKSYQIVRESESHGALQEMEWRGLNVLYAQCRTGVPFGLIIGFRIEKKLPNEKPGDIIPIITIDRSKAMDPEDLELVSQLIDFFSDFLEGNINFYK